MAGVLVFGEVARGGLSSVSLEVAAAGQRVAAGLGEPFLGALVGSGVQEIADEFRSAGFATLYLADDPAFEPYTADAYVAAAAAIVSAAAPSVVLLPHSLNVREWAARLAARLDSGLVTDCTALAVEDGCLVATKPVYGGNAIAQYVVRGTPALATVRPRIFAAVHVPPTGHIVPLEVMLPVPRVEVLEDVREAAGTGPRLQDAKIVVSGGRGVGAPANWRLIDEAAATLGAAVGATRAVTDAGWVPASLQVGLTGVRVAPDLYLAIGVSGAVQHLAGISGARSVVAINSDPEANIFKHARYGVVGDFQQVLPGFLERVKQLRGQVDGHEARAPLLEAE